MFRGSQKIFIYSWMLDWTIIIIIIISVHFLSLKFADKIWIFTFIEGNLIEMPFDEK